MRTFITTILSLLLLVTFVAPVVIDGASVDLGIAFAQDANTPTGEGLIDDNGSRFLGEKALTGVLQSVAALFLQMGAAFLWLAGALFNFGIKYSIIEFASFANIAGIPIAWTVLRDITNVFFIFVFLAIGIGTILNVQQYGVKKLLPVLLAVAVLINFSLFFTKVTIDIAHGFAGAILNQSGVVVTECNSEGDCSISQGVATAFIEQLGIVNIFGASVDTTLGPDERDAPIFTGDKVSDGFSALLFGFFGFIFLSAAAIVFLAGAVLLIMRIVKLLLLMIASAPAMAAYVLPNTRKKFFEPWLNELVKEAFFAPILLLLFSISLLFLNTARGAFVDGDQSFAEIFVNGNLDSVNIIVLFLIALGLLFMSIKAASDMGVSGAKMAMNIQGIAQRTTIGNASRGLDAAGRFTRRTAEAGAARVGAALSAKEGDGAVTGVAKRVGRVGAGFANLTAGTLLRGVDVAASDIAKKGRAAKFGTEYSVDSLAERQKARGQQLNAINAKQGKFKKLSQAERMLSEAERNFGRTEGESDAEFEERKAKASVIQDSQSEVQAALQEMKDAEIEELKATRLATEQIAQNLTPAQFKKLMDSEKLNDSEKDSIAESRFKPIIKAVLEKEDGMIKKIVQSYAKQDLESLPREILLNEKVAQNLKTPQFDDLKKSDSITSAQKKQLGDHRTRPFTQAVERRDVAAIKTAMDKMSPKEISKLKKEQLTDINVIANLKPKDLSAIQKSEDVSGETANAIGETLRQNKDLNKAAYAYITTGPGKNLW